MRRPGVPEARLGVPLAFEVGRHGSVLDEQRSVGPRAPDFFDRYPAAAIDPAAQRPVQAVARFTVDGRPILWFTPDKSGVVVDGAVFTDLDVADATRMRAGERATVGRLLRPEAMDPRELVLFLVHARAVATWVHVGAELTLTDGSTDDGYVARITGEHVYFTNERHEARLSFEVHVSADGVVSVVAG